MSKYTLFANVDGTDLEVVASLIEARLRQFVAGRRWRTARPAVLNENLGSCVITQTGTALLWHLGLRLHLPEIGAEPLDWFGDVVAIAEFLGALHSEFGRSFSISFLNQDDHLEELFLVASSPGEAEKLPMVQGVRYVPCSRDFNL